MLEPKQMRRGDELSHQEVGSLAKCCADCISKRMDMADLADTAGVLSTQAASVAVEKVGLSKVRLGDICFKRLNMIKYACVQISNSTSLTGRRTASVHSCEAPFLHSCEALFHISGLRHSLQGNHGRRHPGSVGSR